MHNYLTFTLPEHRFGVQAQVRLILRSLRAHAPRGSHVFRGIRGIARPLTRRAATIIVAVRAQVFTVPYRALLGRSESFRALANIDQAPRFRQPTNRAVSNCWNSAIRSVHRW